MPVIAVDAMGGDHGPAEAVRGVAQVSLETDIECLLVGDEHKIQAVLEQVPYNPEGIEILHCRDQIGMDDDPKEALKTKKDASLVVGVRAVAGHFERGDAVAILTADGREIGKGLTAYSSEDAARIAGHNSREIEAILGYRGRGEMIHRDDLALSAPSGSVRNG